MKIVVDTNRIIAALIKDSTTRSILYDKNFHFITPDYTIEEINKHKEALKDRTNLTDEEFDVLLALILEHIETIPESHYKDFINECSKDISDPDDLPILALALASNAEGIWAHDPHFKKQQKVKVFTNIDMLKLSSKVKSD